MMESNPANDRRAAKRSRRPSRLAFCLSPVFCLLGCATAQPAPSAPKPPANLSPLEKSLGENPDDQRVNLAFGEEAEASGDLLRAEQYYLRAEALGVPEEKIVPRIIRVLVQAKRYDEALERCQRRLAHEPADRATRFVAAALLAAVDRTQEAERELTALQRTAPDDPASYLALGRLYRDLHDPRARAMFERYLALAPDGQDAAAVRFELAEGALPPVILRGAPRSGPESKDAVPEEPAPAAATPALPKETP